MRGFAGTSRRLVRQFVLFAGATAGTIRSVSINETNGDPTPRRRFASWLKLFVRVVILALVAWGIWRTVDKARGKFAESHFSLADLNYYWLLLSAALYLLGTFPSCVFWYRTLLSMGQRPNWASTVRAFYVGHLGKYVPGKAMVIVIRTGMIRCAAVDTTVAATSIFIETLTMMAVGSMVSAALLACLLRQHSTLAVSSLVLMVAAGLPTFPPVFRRVVRFLRVHRASAAMDQALDGLNWRLVVFGWAIITVEWLMFGVSLWATLCAVPNIHSSLADLPLLTACVSLAMLAGFLSLVPGGLGVRELVVMQLIKPVYGEVAALAVAVLLRLVWLAAELVMAAIVTVALPGPDTGKTAETPQA